jgi:hypothetical protein
MHYNLSWIQISKADTILNKSFMLKSDTKKVSKETKADTIKTDALNVIL